MKGFLKSDLQILRNHMFWSHRKAFSQSMLIWFSFLYCVQTTQAVALVQPIFEYTIPKSVRSFFFANKNKQPVTKIWDVEPQWEREIQRFVVNGEPCCCCFNISLLSSILNPMNIEAKWLLAQYHKHFRLTCNTSFNKAFIIKFIQKCCSFNKLSRFWAL